jgi:TetR/AcrR family transcriptional repressor of bet genes
MNQKKNTAVQSERRTRLIDAAIGAIAEHGLSNVTLAKIASGAGLSAGTVNFHFDSKESLLLETLSHVADEFEQRIFAAIDNAENNPADKLIALFEASLDPQLTEPGKTAVWFAFAAEARSRADYQRICGAQDEKIFATTLALCVEIIRSGGKQDVMNPRAMANAIQGLIDETWEEILYAGDKHDRDDAQFIYKAFLASVFPWAFDQPHKPTGSEPRLTTDDKSLHISRAGKDDAKEIAKLFNLYRQFYEEPSNLRLASRFIRQNLDQERSVIFIARDTDGSSLGFVQLYAGLCSVEAKPFWTLYDLYVDASARKRGVGRELMLAAETHARKTKACRLDLETAHDNFIGQALYEDLGYLRDTHFYKYSLALD